jgi:hypothetical protein
MADEINWSDSIYSDTPAGADTTSYNSNGTTNTGGTAYSGDLTSGSIDPAAISGLDLTQIQKLLSGTGAGGMAGQMLGLGGIGALLNKVMGGGSQGGYSGYQGSIPSYTASRTMNAIPQTVPTAAQAEVPATATHAAIPAVPAGTAPRRPGSGGITYFSPMQYVPKVVPAAGGGMMSSGGISALGGYSDGGRLLKGPGDGVSDSIPATIGGKQPARLADGEFVIPARIVSEIGNGSTEAGAKKLYAMMDRVQSVRRKSFKNVAANTKADKYLPR